MPRVAKLKNGTFVRLCWCCIETGLPRPTSGPEKTPELAVKRGTPKCGDCHQRALAGLPTGWRIDA